MTDPHGPAIAPQNDLSRWLTSQGRVQRLWAWSTAGEILDLYGRLHQLSDLDLYAECCLDPCQAFTENCDRGEVACWANSMALAYIHGYVTKRGSKRVS
jgi:hypothetical protein